jgi:hypothetical protein
MVCHRVQPGTPAISYKLITTKRVHYNYLLGFEMGEWGMGVGYQVPDTG